MEWVILDVLEYECFSPTTLNFLWFYLKAVEADEELERHAKVLAISSLSHHELLCFWPSTVAAGLVVQACSAKGQRSAAERIFETHVRSKEDLNDLEDCVKLIGSPDKPFP
ncbi:cyclin-SDS isoform X2 [Nymphaea colorata]|nr:cyclin-SDS isoform X2 [Nymphaea colorata]